MATTITRVLIISLSHILLFLTFCVTFTTENRLVMIVNFILSTFFAGFAYAPHTSIGSAWLLFMEIIFVAPAMFMFIIMLHPDLKQSITGTSHVVLMVECTGIILHWFCFAVEFPTRERLGIVAV